MVAPILCLAVLSSMQVGSRPSQPDFSGEWILVNPTNPAADVATALSVRQPIVENTVRGGSMPPAYLELVVERHLPVGNRSETYRIGVDGGMVGGLPAGVRFETRQSVKWDGDSLVIATSRWSGPPEDRRLDERRSEVWQLDSKGRLVVTISEHEDKRELRTELTYRRR